MTNFEQFLISKGYIMFAFDAKEMKYYKPKEHIISTMFNLGHIYVHESNTDFLNSIYKGTRVTEEEFKNIDISKNIIFGLREKDKPCTLICPRPNIRVKRYREIDGVQTEVEENQLYDDSMNIVLSQIDCEIIFKAMYNPSICFEFDLTKETP